MHHMDVDVRCAAARVRGPAVPRKTRARQIEAAPKELHRARLAEKVRAEALENGVRAQQGGLKTPDVLAVVRPHFDVVEERDGHGHFDRHRHDPRVRNAETREVGQHLPVEIGDRHRMQRPRGPATATGDDDELVLDEVEVDLKCISLGVNERRAEAARGHDERRIPPVVHERGEREADLSDHLRPHVDRVQRVLPLRVRERWPRCPAAVRRGGVGATCRAHIWRTLAASAGHRRLPRSHRTAANLPSSGSPASSQSSSPPE